MIQIIVCRNCEYSGRESDEYPCETCHHYENFKKKKQLTNGDKIRSMSDSELAWFLCGVFDDGSAKFICGDTIPHYDEDKIVEWLKSPTND